MPLAYKIPRWRIEDLRIDLVDDLSADGIATIRIGAPGGVLTIMGVPSERGRLLLVRGAHISSEGLTAGQVGPFNLAIAAEAVMRELDYDGLLVEGEVRTTGARKGRRPRPFRFARNNRD